MRYFRSSSQRTRLGLPQTGLSMREIRELLRRRQTKSGAATASSLRWRAIDLDRRALKPLPIQDSPRGRTARPRSMVASMSSANPDEHYLLDRHFAMGVHR